jgi:hypothetical protein
MPDKFQLVDCNFGSDTDAEMTEYIERQIEFLVTSHSDLHKNRIPKWRKLYLGIPAEEIKSFPWPNAANTIVQVIGEIVDTIAARVLGLLYATHPLWVYQDFRKVDPDDAAKFESTERERHVLEDFMDLVGYEPSELDLYRVEGLWYTDAARLGTAFLKVGYEQNLEVTNVGYTESKSKVQGTESTIYAGPRVSKLRHEDVYLTPDASTTCDAEFACQVRTLRRKALEERAFTGGYDKKSVAAILQSPDRQRPKQQVNEELQDQGIAVRGEFDATAEWDIYECYYAWWHNGKKFRIIDSYHKMSKTILRRVFNFLPDNELPIVRARMGYRTDGMYGHGFAELLERYQEELSTVHNQRIDNATAANTRALRVSPRARNLDSNVELYPMALLVGEKDDIEAIQIADVYPSSFQNEMVTQGLAQSRAGISPAISGAGGGGPLSKKSSTYSAGPAMAAMQESNSRVNLEASDFRHAHVKLGSLLTAMYGKFGIGDRSKIFGLDGDSLKSAFKAYDERRLAIPIRASTASLNREMDKQSDMLLAGLMQRHYTAIGQLMQAMSSPMIPEDVKDYMQKTVRSLDRFMKRVLRDFGYDQPDQFIPEPRLPQPSGADQGGAGGRQMAPAQSSIQSTIAAASGGGGQVVPAPSGAGVSGGPPQPPPAGGGTAPV